MGKSGQFSSHDHKCRATVAMTHPFPPLFSPLTLDSETLKRRPNLGAHTANRSAPCEGINIT